ncbi:5236_t:CDS:1, partial [Gigaspora rosea]
HGTFTRLTLMMLDEITYWMMCHNDKTSWIRIPVCEVTLIMTIWDWNS